MLFSIVKMVPSWESSKDRKLSALEDLLKNQHSEDKVLIFTQYADTAKYLHNELEKRNVCKLGLAIGGSNNITLLAQRFSPISNNANINQNDEIRFLISTDVLSEGQNLQDSHIVVNFDLPWALIRLIQRAGRVDRLGQKSEVIYCYSFLPEDGIEKIIRLRDKLKHRITHNAEVVGSDEVFFDGDPVNIADLYSERSGILDEDDDVEVDLASYAYQIWKNAIDLHPELSKTVPNLPNVVYSTKRNNASKDDDSLIVYTKTIDDNDVLSWINNDGKIITQSQHTILKAAECNADLSCEPRIKGHHELVSKAVELINAEERSATGTLGRKTGVKYRTYMKLRRFVDENDNTIFVTESHKRSLDDVYKFPLREQARDILSRQLKTNVSDVDFANSIVSLRDENKLCIIDNEEYEYKPTQIICSLGMRKAG